MGKNLILEKQLTEDYLAQRANRKEFTKIVNNVKAKTPMKGDKLQCKILNIITC